MPGVAGIAGRLFSSWASDALGRRASILLVGMAAAIACSLAGFLSGAYVGAVSVFFLMILVQQFFGSGIYAIVGPYMAEVWPSKLRASGMGVGYRVGNLGKFIGPAGLAVIAVSSNFVSPTMPLPPPVTSATLPVKSILSPSGLLSFHRPPVTFNVVPVM